MLSDIAIIALTNQPTPICEETLQNNNFRSYYNCSNTFTFIHELEKLANSLAFTCAVNYSYSVTCVFCGKYCVYKTPYNIFMFFMHVILNCCVGLQTFFLTPQRLALYESS